MIVAAYHCLNTWITAHSFLMADGPCMKIVHRVVLLGLTGAPVYASEFITDTLMSDSCPWVITKGGPIYKPSKVTSTLMKTTSPSYRVQQAASLVSQTLLFLTKVTGINIRG